MNKRVRQILASGLGVGYIPFASGTFGSLLGVLLYPLLFAPMELLLRVISIIAFTFLSIYIAHAAEDDFGEKDSSKIVIDEVIGMQWALVFFSFTIINVFVVFALFRFFDIFKIFPANYCEQKFSGGIAVVADDVVAGIYAGLCLLIFNTVMN